MVGRGSRATRVIRKALRLSVNYRVHRPKNGRAVAALPSKRRWPMTPFSRHDRRPACAALQKRFPGIHAQPAGLRGSVTRITIFREDRPDLGFEEILSRSRSSRGGSDQQSCCNIRVWANKSLALSHGAISLHGLGITSVFLKRRASCNVATTLAQGILQRCM